MNASATTCDICRLQRSLAHWAWHRYCRAELNPIALLGLLDLMEQTDQVRRITAYVVASTGMDVTAARLALRAEMAETA